MTTEERREKIAELRKYHEPTFEVLGVPAGYYTCKNAHYFPEGGTEKCIGLYESEASKGDDVYIEFVTMQYTPADASRRLYVWKHEKDFAKYPLKKEQYMIPVTVLKEVLSTKLGDGAVAMVSSKTISETEYRTKETKTETYVTKYFEDGLGNKIEAVWKNGLPHSMSHSLKAGMGCRIEAEAINHILNIFK